MSVGKFVKWAAILSVAAGLLVIAVDLRRGYVAFLEVYGPPTEEELADHAAHIAYHRDIDAERKRYDEDVAGARSACDEAARSRLGDAATVAFPDAYRPAPRRTGDGWRIAGDVTAMTGTEPERAYRYVCTITGAAVTELTIREP